jgi:hypothetical protein
MSFVELYISDRYDSLEDLESLNKQLSHLGFDPAEDEFKTFAYFRTTEGYDVYYDLRQLLRVSTEIDNRKAVIAFELRAIQDEKVSDFYLNDLTARLYMTDLPELDKMAEVSFGKSKGFPNKKQMILRVKELASQKLALEKAQGKAMEINKLLGKTLTTGHQYKLKA